MTSAWILCPIVFAPSYLGLVLSLRDVESRRRSWRPEIASDYFALTFSVSRGPFRIFGLMRPAAGLNFWLLRCPAAVWPSNVVDEHLGGAPPELSISKRTSEHRRRDRELFVCFYIPRGTNDFHGFSSHFAFGRFVFRCAQHTQRTLETSRSVRAFKKTIRTHIITLETFVAFETPEAPIAFETGVRFLSVLRLVGIFYFRERPRK